VTTTSKTLKSLAPKAGLFSFVFVMYSYTTGGPFGLEEQVSNSGPGMTLLYHLLIPFLWCIPISLVAAELTTAMPVQGGFYRWVRAAFGDFWGFQAGWWNWTASFPFGSAYAVLFADYLRFYFPQVTGWKHFLIAAALIAVMTDVNVRGIQDGRPRLNTPRNFRARAHSGDEHSRARKMAPQSFCSGSTSSSPLFQVFGVGLALGVWLYSGYEQLSTVAEEVDNPRRNFPRALALVVPLSIATYFLPTFAARGPRQLGAMARRLCLCRRKINRRPHARSMGSFSRDGDQHRPAQ
jgi:amino acid transporter